jgi:hypothetical protein
MSIASNMLVIIVGQLIAGRWLSHKLSHNLSHDVAIAVEVKVQESREMITGDQSIKAVRQASVAITVTNASGGEIRGSGNVVDLGGFCFVSTCAHVAWPLDWSGIRYKLRLENGDRVYLRNQTVRLDRTHDIAIIPIVCPLDVDPLQVSQTRLAFGVQLWGTCLWKTGIVLMYCRIVEEAYNNTFKQAVQQGDCGGSPGFSGTGLVNEKRVVIGMHKGAGDFRESTDADDFRESTDADESMAARWDEALRKCDRTSLRKCLAGFRKIIEITARNPRTNVIDARWIHELWKSLQVKP